MVQRRGWHVQGLESAGGAWGGLTPIAALAAPLGDEAASALLANVSVPETFSLKDVAALGAMIEASVHEEMLARLASAMRLAASSPELQGQDATARAEAVLDIYLMLYIFKADHTSITQRQLELARKGVEHAYPHWNATRAWAHQVRREALESRPGASQPQILAQVMNSFGRWKTEHQCQVLKDELLGLQDSWSGRVPLHSFYKSALSGENWQLMESKAYLGQLGALDESDASRPSVIITNYIEAPTNCVGGAEKFYSVCCISECGAIVDRIERNISGPMATPARLLELLLEEKEGQRQGAGAAARSQQAAALAESVEQVATLHGGGVPLQGRLFAQLLHHAFPEECPFPHPAGTFQPTDPETWERTTGEAARLDEASLRWQLAELRPAPYANADVAPSPPWLWEEELLPSASSSHEAASSPAVPWAASEIGGGGSGGVGGEVGRALAFLVIAASMVLAASQRLAAARCAAGRGSLKQIRV